MEEQQEINPLAVTHLLQHTLRSLCIQDNNNNSQWVYAVFWRILPRNYPPPKWDIQGGMYGRSRGNRRNWILAWEDGFCNFGASTGSSEQAVAAEPGSSSQEMMKLGLQPEVFFKMSHEIYNYGEGIIGKVAADHSHKWVHKEADQDQQEANFLSSWNNPADSHPRTWEAQFQAGIKTIALIAVGEGVVQLGSINKVIEDLSYVILLRKKFAYLESIPGVLLPHPSSSGIPMTAMPPHEPWHSYSAPPVPVVPPPPPAELYGQYLSHHHHQMMATSNITPSMSSLEALLSKLPSVGPVEPNTSTSALGYYEMPVPAKEEIAGEEYGSSSMSSYYVNARDKSHHHE